jgi:MEDS: MEthanogen/methylotroph, DcmR Sensory domain
VATPEEYRDRATRVSDRHDDIFAEEITGWATNLFFPIPSLPNHYVRIPWRRIIESRGAVRGVLFVVRILALWPFELMIKVLRPRDHLAERNKNRNEFSEYNHGDHICFLYRNEDALQEMLARFVNEGLEKGEQCVCVETMRVQERLCGDLRSLGIDFEKDIAKGSLVFLSEEEVYFRNGEFDPQGLVEQLTESINRSQEAGYSGFRISGEISRASSDARIQEKVIDYERRVDRYFVGKKAIGLCHYRSEAFSEEMLDSVIDAHGLHVLESLASG